MSDSFLDTLSKTVDEVASLSKNQEKKIISNLQFALQTTIDYLSKELPLKIITEIRKIELGKVKKENSLSFGIKRTKSKIIFGNWVFDLMLEKKNSLLFYFILKEALFHFLDFRENDIDEMVLNIISILFFVKLKNITLEHIQFIFITSQTITEEIAGEDYQIWLNMIPLLVAKNIPFSDVFSFYLSLFQNMKSPNSIKGLKFKEWVIDQTFQEENYISPIYFTQKQFEIVERLFSLDYNQFSIKYLSKSLSLHPDTLRNRFRSLHNYGSAWIANINFNKLKLNRYFLKIRTDGKTNFDSLGNFLLKNPYLKILYHGSNEDSKFYYSPRFYCPHFVAEQLTNTLIGYQDKNLIKNFSLQLIKKITHYNTFINSPLNPSITNFQKLLNGEINQAKKFSISYFSLNNTIDFSEDKTSLDRTLLYFLSLVKSRYLTKGKIAVELQQIDNFYKENDIPFIDDYSRTDFLNQQEIRSRRRGLLDYYFYIRNFTPRGSDILIIELSKDNSLDESSLETLIEKLRVFSFMGRLDLTNHVILTLPGISHIHPISSLIQDTIDQFAIDSHLFTINLLASRYSPFQDLFDYEEQKWKFSLQG